MNVTARERLLEAIEEYEIQEMLEQFLAHERQLLVQDEQPPKVKH